MTLAKFSRMCEALESITPTNKTAMINTSLSTFSNKSLAIKILSLEYPSNNIGGKRAVTWISNAMGLFEDELEGSIYTWGDIGEALYDLDAGNEEDSTITLQEFNSLLELDCSRINSDSYIIFSEALGRMSAREKKWFTRYWLHKPRNGVNNKIPLKAMKLHYTDNNIEKYYQYNKAWEICAELEAGNEPECKLVHGQFVNPMLAKARKGKEKPTNYMVDVKYDGNRYQIHKHEKSIIIFNRKGKVVTDQYPDVVDEVIKFDADSFIIDTEIYPVNPDGTPAPHKLLGKRVHKKDKAEAVKECPVKMVAFDLLSLRGKPYLESPLSKRWLWLSANFLPENTAEYFSNCTIQSAYNQAIEKGFEGIMIKDTDMAYQPGKRSKGWLKYKPPRISLDVVITSAQYGEGKRSNVFGTYGISVKNDSDYVPVGSIGTGFSDWDLEWLTTELKKNIDYFSDNTFYFMPRIVLEISCDLVTTDANDNIGLRFPRNIRIRHDKYPSDIDTLQTVSEMI